MRRELFCAGILGFASVVFVQTPTSPDPHLRGGRFKPLSYAEMTPEQKTMTDDVLRGERGSMNGPYNVLLRSP